MQTAILIASMLILLLGSGYFSGAEAALFSLSSTQIKSYRNDRDPRKRLIAKLLLQPRDLLVTVFMLNTLVNILLQNTSAKLFGDTASWIFTVGLPLILTLVFGEIIPKYIGLQHNIAISYRIVPSLNFWQKLMEPIRRMTLAITIPLSRLMFFYLKKEEEISKEELEHILKTSEAHGVFDKDEGELIAGYLHLQDDQVKDLLRPREDILYYDIEEPLTKLIYLFIDQKCSRLPVCNHNLENILGIITAKQFFLHRETIKTPQDIIPILEKPFYVPETTSARLLLRRLDEKLQLALAVDEYGSLSGLITREDLIEVVVGDITDLRDQQQLYTRAGDNEIIASGKLELEEFNDLFDLSLSSPSSQVTIGGWLMERLEEIPKSGSKHEIDGFLFQILASTPNRIRRLYIRRLGKNSTNSKKTG
jgi:CBS domain containing-hemolysin-like protein